VQRRNAGVVEILALREFRRRAQRQATAVNVPLANFTTFVPPALRAEFSQRENFHHSVPETRFP
jgi:hypothetical protein